jgi:hypothetical protein
VLVTAEMTPEPTRAQRPPGRQIVALTVAATPFQVLSTESVAVRL